jgi:hypothetical protein
MHGRRLRCTCVLEAASDRGPAVAPIELSEEGPKDDAKTLRTRHWASREMG